MQNVNNFKKYKEAKIILPHLEGILKVINLSIKSLSIFNTYIPVQRILKVMTEQKVILEEHQKLYTITLKNKGKQSNE